MKKYTCKAVFPKKFPYEKRKSFYKLYLGYGFHDGNKPKDDCLHLAFPSESLRDMNVRLLNRKGFKTTKTN